MDTRSVTWNNPNSEFRVDTSITDFRDAYPADAFTNMKASTASFSAGNEHNADAMLHKDADGAAQFSDEHKHGADLCLTSEANVEMRTANLHVGMVEDFGLPNACDPEYEELFGLYHYDDNTQYWSFNPRLNQWSVKSGRTDNNELELSASIWTPSEREIVTELLRDLQLLKKPLPPKGCSYQEKPPFVYKGWLFAWIFVPELGRWEIAPLGRR